MLSLCSILAATAQTVTIAGPEEVEVGIEHEFTATVTNLGNKTVVRYEWSADFNGNCVSGTSSIEGSINGGCDIPTVVETSATSNTATIIWGDFFDSFTDNARVRVFFSDGNFDDDVLDVSVHRICIPTITGPSTLQRCCTAPVNFTVTNFCDGNIFNWTVSGGTLTSGNGTQTITVTPSASNTLTVTCTVGRSQAATAYTRSKSKSVTRSTPATPAISGATTFCQNTSYQLCVASICGQTGVTWTVPSASLQLISGQGTTCITVQPVAGVPNGTTGTVTAKATVSGGCTVNSSPAYNFKIFTSETPPAPQGYISLVLLSGDPPCGPLFYQVVFNAGNPYQNGTTTVVPSTLWFNHHPWQQPVPKKVKVCYNNACSGISTCTNFMVYPPTPCEGDPLTGSPNKDILSSKEAIPYFLSAPTDVAAGSFLYPNPSNGQFRFKSSADNPHGCLTIYDSMGSPVFAKEVSYLQNGEEILLKKPLATGLYYARLQSGSQTFTQKIIVQ